MPGGISNASSAVGTVSLLNGNTQLAGKTLIPRSDHANGGSTILYTVPAGKTFYLINATLNIYSTQNAVVGQFQTGAASILLCLESDVNAAKLTDSKCFSVAYPHPIPVYAGDTLSVYSSHANLTATAYIVGWEE
jgi:hypothetical protein